MIQKNGPGLDLMQDGQRRCDQIAGSLVGKNEHIYIFRVYSVGIEAQASEDKDHLAARFDLVCQRFLLFLILWMVDPQEEQICEIFDNPGAEERMPDQLFIEGDMSAFQDFDADLAEYELIIRSYDDDLAAVDALAFQCGCGGGGAVDGCVGICHDLGNTLEMVDMTVCDQDGIFLQIGEQRWVVGGSSQSQKRIDQKPVVLVFNE